MAPTLQTLAQFDNSAGPLGFEPNGDLLVDAKGDLFGTNKDGGDGTGVGTVFEIVNDGTVADPSYSSAPVELAIFPGTEADGALPDDGLIADANGDLFGTTTSGGTNYGTVFEIVNSGAIANPSYAGAPQVLVNFTGQSGADPGGYPYADLSADANGNLFGTTTGGGANNDGTVFELVNNGTLAEPSYAAAKVLVSFTVESLATGGLLIDAHGDLFGTTGSGGDSNGDGTVFEIVNNGANADPSYATTPTTLAEFDFTDGANPYGRLVADSKGDLFGTTRSGGDSNGDGTVFEIVNNGSNADPSYATTPTTLAEFDFTDGANPNGNLIIDANGDLFGTTQDGADESLGNGNGTVFEIVNNATAANPSYDATPNTLVSFTGLGGADPGSEPSNGLTVDSNGDLFGATSGGGANDAGTVFEVGNSGFVSSPPCYARGTRILTDRGEVAVEELRIGDLAVTLSGARRPIVWIGRRALDISRHPDPAVVRPVRVSKGAFGAGLPHRDLWLSPGHNIAFEGVLMPISALVNSVSVAQIDQQRIEYWHVELDAHDILFAEGLPAESYLDCGNRTAFANGGAFSEAHPDFEPRHWADTCLPLMKEGPPVARTKARLIERLAKQGHLVDQEADPHLLVDGLRVAPIRLSETRLAFVLAPGGRKIELRSKLFVPAHTIAESADARELGLCVGRLQIDGSDLALEDDKLCASGWREAEHTGGRFAHRWTTGGPPLPAGARIVIVDLAGVGHYWRRSDNSVIALCAF